MGKNRKLRTLNMSFRSAPKRDFATTAVGLLGLDLVKGSGRPWTVVTDAQCDGQIRLLLLQLALGWGCLDCRWLVSPLVATAGTLVTVVEQGTHERLVEGFRQLFRKVRPDISQVEADVIPLRARVHL